MRWIFKIILSPISLVLSIMTAFMTFLLDIGTALMYKHNGVLYIWSVSFFHSRESRNRYIGLGHQFHI